MTHIHPGSAERPNVTPLRADTLAESGCALPEPAEVEKVRDAFNGNCVNGCARMGFPAFAGRCLDCEGGRRGRLSVAVNNTALDTAGVTK